MLLDPDTWTLAQRADAVLALLGDDLAGRCSAETHEAALELNTGPHATVAGAIAELGGLRARLARDARALGLATAAAGMHPADDGRGPAGLAGAALPARAPHHARDRPPRADLRPARAHRRGGPRERDPAAQPPARPSAAAPGAVGQLAAVARPGDGAGLEPHDPLPGLPAHRRCRGASTDYADWVRTVDVLAALGRDPGADLPVVGRAAAAPVRHRRGAHHGRPAAARGRRAPCARSCRRWPGWSSRRATRRAGSWTPRKRSPRTASWPPATAWRPSSSTPCARSACRSPTCSPTSSTRPLPHAAALGAADELAAVPALVAAPEAAPPGGAGRPRGRPRAGVRPRPALPPRRWPVSDIARPSSTADITAVSARRRPRPRAARRIVANAACTPSSWCAPPHVTHVHGLARARRRGQDQLAMDTDRARLISERLHASDREEDGTPLLQHIRRVAYEVPAEARTVAWLHEAFEWTAVAEQELLASGLDERRAPRPQTAPSHSWLALRPRLPRAPAPDRASGRPLRGSGARGQDRRSGGPPRASARPSRRLVAAVRAQSDLLRDPFDGWRGAVTTAANGHAAEARCGVRRA